MYEAACTNKKYFYGTILFHTIDMVIIKHNQAISLPTCSQIQLSKILLLTFNGNVLQWRLFRDTFTFLVHDNRSLSKIEKIQYLLSSVSRTATSCVQSLSLTEDTYSIIWDNLYTQYDNKRELMNANLDAIFYFELLSIKPL